MINVWQSPNIWSTGGGYVMIASSGNYTYNGTGILINIPGRVWTVKSPATTNWTDK